MQVRGGGWSKCGKDTLFQGEGEDGSKWRSRADNFKIHRCGQTSKMVWETLKLSVEKKPAEIQRIRLYAANLWNFTGTISHTFSACKSYIFDQSNSLYEIHRVAVPTETRFSDYMGLKPVGVYNNWELLDRKSPLSDRSDFSLHFFPEG